MTNRITTAAAAAAGAPGRGRLVIALLACVLAAAGSSTARAEEADRAGRVDVFVLGQYAVGDESDASFSLLGAEVELEYDDTFGGGIGFGFHVTDNINLNATVIGGEATLETFVIIPARFPTGEAEATFIAPDFNVDWNLLDAPLTPFVTAGAGWMYFSFDDDNESAFSYGGGAGVRWDFAENWFLKAWYRAKWFEIDGAADTFLTHTFNLGIGVSL